MKKVLLTMCALAFAVTMQAQDRVAEKADKKADKVEQKAETKTVTPKKGAAAFKTNSKHTIPYECVV